ncbi:MAG: DUF4355 domain-containing protein [Peptoniphilaceae bacterium]|nr:DUF4355 domain-containing protein [Peptoniphilaceae bacterium]
MEDVKNDVIEEETNLAHEGEEQSQGLDSSKEDKVSNEEKELKYTDEDVDRIIDKKFAKWQKQQEKQINDLKEAQKLEKMNEEEKKDYEFEKLKEELADYKKRDNLNQMAKVAKNMFADYELDVPDSLVANLITEEAESTKEIVVDTAKMIKDLVDKETIKRLKGKSPQVKTTPTKDTKALKSEILGIKDAVRRRELMAENLELFE